MVPQTASLFAALVSLGGLELAAARGLANARELTPRYSLPKHFKRQINYKASSPVPSSTAASGLLDSILSPKSTTKASSTDSGTEVVIVPITLSIDINGVTHTITGAPQTTNTQAAAATSTSTSITTEAASDSVTTTADTTTTAAAPSSTKTTADTTTTETSTRTTETSSTASPTKLDETLDDIWSSLFSLTPTSTADSTSVTSTSSASETTSLSTSVDAVNATTSATSSATTSETTSVTTGTITSTATTSTNATSSTTSSGGFLDDLPTISISIPVVKPTSSSSDVLSSDSWTLPTSTISLPSDLTSVLFPTTSTETRPSSIPVIVPTVTASSHSAVPTTSSGPATSSTESKTTSQTTHTSTSTHSQPTTTSTTETTTETTTTTTTTSVTTEETSTDFNWVPSSILVEPTPTAQETATQETTQEAAPTELPGSISPAGGASDIPVDSTLIQLGFTRELRYSFVATHPLSSSQIFLYIPEGLIYALNAISSDIVMVTIKPYDNSATTGYIATVAQAFIPTDKISSLEKMLINPVSKFYDQPNGSVKTLMSMIDPSIPLIVGDSSSSDYSSSSTSSGGYGDDSGNDDQSSVETYDDSVAGSNSSSSAKPSSVGIGVGVVAGAAAYGAAMFWVARRYRKRRQLHRRTNSTVEQMSEGPGAGSLFAAGGRLSRGGQSSRGSQRTQMISAPVMAENSLGWN